jgi:hypothetical protein
MKSLYDLEESGDKHGFLRFFLKYLLVVAALLLLAGGGFIFWFYHEFFKRWDDANIVCPTDSKDSWNYFLENVSSDTSNIKNVKAENHSNIRQREFTITFETDSETLLKIIAQKQLTGDTAFPESFHKDYPRTHESIAFEKKAGKNALQVTYFLQDHALIHTCDTIRGRCVADVGTTYNRFNESFLAAYKSRLNPRNFAPDEDGNRISTITYFICPSGRVCKAAITDQWNKFDDDFKKCYLTEFNKIDFGKIDRTDSLDCQNPIVFRSMESNSAHTH